MLWRHLPPNPTLADRWGWTLYWLFAGVYGDWRRRGLRHVHDAEIAYRFMGLWKRLRRVLEAWQAGTLRPPREPKGVLRKVSRLLTATLTSPLPRRRFGNRNSAGTASPRMWQNGRSTRPICAGAAAIAACISASACKSRLNAVTQCCRSGSTSAFSHPNVRGSTFRHPAPAA